MPANARLVWLDTTRGVALVAMAVYHFVFDLEMFGQVARGTALAPPWSWLASATAGSFLFLAGVSLYLAHGQGIHWRGFWWRFAKIAAAAALVSGGTYLADPNTFVFFGILHAIAAFSLLGLAVLRLPSAVLLVLSLVLLLGAPWLKHTAFDHPALWWTGLNVHIPLTVDYEPLFPWAAPVVAGILAAKWLPASLLQRAHPRRLPIRVLSWAGRHSLLIYLIHQPLLIGLIWSVLYLIG